MHSILRTAVFDKWLLKLIDTRGKARIIERIRSAGRGHFGDCKHVGNNVSEMRVNFRPGYRIYFIRTGEMIYILFCGGTKNSQQHDIKKAKEMARQLKEN